MPHVLSSSERLTEVLCPSVRHSSCSHTRDPRGQPALAASAALRKLLRTRRHQTCGAAWQQCAAAIVVAFTSASLVTVGAADAQPLPSEEAPSQQTDDSGLEGELLTAPEVSGSDLTQEDYTQVVDQLRNRILPQAKELLDRAKRDGGTTIPTSFEQALQTVVTEAERLLELAKPTPDDMPDMAASNVKSTADGIEQQLTVFRSLFDVPD